MPAKAKAPAKKAAPKARAVSAKPATKRGVAKGEKVECQVCGLAVVVDQIGDIVVEEDNVLLCCGKPMKKTAVKKVAAKKAPAKKTAAKK
jgi:hypothetical protein